MRETKIIFVKAESSLAQQQQQQHNTYYGLCQFHGKEMSRENVKFKINRNRIVHIGAEEAHYM